MDICVPDDFKALVVHTCLLCWCREPTTTKAIEVGQRDNYSDSTIVMLLLGLTGLCLLQSISMPSLDSTTESSSHLVTRLALSHLVKRFALVCPHCKHKQE